MKKTSISPQTPVEIRRNYLKHEAAIMMVGQFYYFIGMGLLLCAVTGLIIKQFGAALSWQDSLSLAAVLLVLGALYALVGYGFRCLAKWSRYAASLLAIVTLASLRTNTSVQGYAATVLALISMFAMPIGIVITFYAAYLVLSPKGSVVFSKEYRNVISTTPEISYSFSRIFVFMGLFLIAVQSFFVLSVFKITPH